MMKRVIPFLLGLAICAAICLADYSDGFITAGEYEYGVDWFSNNPPLIVDGGGAYWIEMRNFGRLEVRSTSTPLGLGVGGIMNILLDDYSTLTYLGGETEEILIYDDALATLKGGRIDYITSRQYATTKHVDIYSQPGWSWETIYDPVEQEDIITGITGLWEDNTPFAINFLNDVDYDPVWININIVEIPEPATFLMLGLGGLLLRRKQQAGSGNPNDRDWPDVQNCILWYNNEGNEQVSGFEQDVHASYCFIQDCNEEGTTNFSDNPKFAYHDPNNVHLAYDSPCKDAGNQELSYDDQVDMDSEDRVVGDYVDVGADELYSCDGDYSEDDFYNALDWNADGVINMHEFSKFSSAWLTEDPNAPWQPTDPSLIDNWNATCNLDPNGTSAYTIDLADLVVFASETPWLWQACWRDNYIEMYGMMMGGGGEGMMESMAAGFEESSYEYEEQNVYADMSEQELALFVKGIYEMIEQLEIWIEEDLEDADSAVEILGHLEIMLVDIKESRQ